ncbi:BZ3500_MvSof-1268-A1-R1_Chr5-3g08172 [Microbotryum saponariae]|uniref:BZ3500_MvSof-1268-A1-R1_Chr5-3g08172 protein n=1 Tax=Microbotryum saponariae TaxID=289078 RepID=A0A2X0LLB9_9BASI|nr:BZ3500_MvSof-1268-A1-R1_Chr5-3g08172 [Microbotryum saponariae]SDA07931.1 BZ3501_MvSof-1269-A2-R1_Chr5-1g07316 [Microbotryum saponariae]
MTTVAVALKPIALAPRTLGHSYTEIHRFFTKLGHQQPHFHSSSTPRDALHHPQGWTKASHRPGTLVRLASSRPSVASISTSATWKRAYTSCPSPKCPQNAANASASASSSTSSSTDSPNTPYYPSQDKGPPPPPPAATTPSTALSKPTPQIPTALPKSSPSYLSSLPASLRRLAVTLPSYAPGRPPSRDQLLEVTHGFFERLRIRFKWLTIRSYRHFRADDYSAFFSFGILGTLGWFLLSTTSFLSFCFLVVNSISSQNWLGTKLGNYLTKSTGVRVVFESAIVPKWGVLGGTSKIVFKNVFVSRGTTADHYNAATRSKTLAINDLDRSGSKDEDGAHAQSEQASLDDEQMAKWTHFHLSIDTIEVTLSLRRWLDGKGLVKDAVVKGVRGIVAHPGDFWLESLQIQDFLVTIYQPDQFRPYTFSIFNADIRRFRKQWLFYDLMSAESVVGQVDNCLFSLHTPQSIGRTSEMDLKDARWGRMSRFRIDGVPIDHMQSAKDTGVLSWITSGRCDIVADIRFPRDGDELDLSTLMADLVDEIGGRLQIATNGGEPASATSTTGVSSKGDRIPGRGTLTREALSAPEEWQVEKRKQAELRKEVRRAERNARVVAEAEAMEEEDKEDTEVTKHEWIDHTVSIDLDIRFKDLKASVPYFTSDLSYVNNALIRPIVAFINSHHTLVPIHCHIDLDLDEFDGSWTTYDVGLLDRMSEQTYAALAHHVQNANQQRLQAVSLWTLQMTAQGVLAAFRNNLAFNGGGS